MATACSADEALTSLELFGPNVLVSDLGMPGRDGYDLIREVRARGYSEDRLPAIALTALARPEDRRRALLAGFQLHAPKPNDAAELPRQPWVYPAVRFSPWGIPNLLRVKPSIPRQGAAESESGRLGRLQRVIRELTSGIRRRA